MTSYTKILMLALALLVLPHFAVAKERGVAVIVGNKAYEDDRVPTVDYAHNDAAAFRRFVVEQLRFDEANIIELMDATRGQMDSAFGRAGNEKGLLWRYVEPDGSSDVIVFYSGHGVPGVNDGRGYLLPIDGNPDTAEINGYPIDVLYENLANVPSKSVTVFVDACFSGGSGDGGRLIAAASPVYVTADVSGLPGLTVLTAASGRQLASWDSKARHGLFTTHLLDALYGAADTDGDRNVSAAETKLYLDRHMTRAARRVYGREQYAGLQGDEGAVLSFAKQGGWRARPQLGPPPAAFTVLVEPTEARIRILNIGPPYRAAMGLGPGSYNVEASAAGYATKTETVKHGTSPTVHRIALAKLGSSPESHRPRQSEEGTAQEMLFWQSIAADDSTGFEAYLSSYPEGAFAPLAMGRLRDLVWVPIENSDDPLAVAKYLEAHPEGRFARLARERLEAHLGQADYPELDAYLGRYPQGEFNALARSRATEPAVLASRAVAAAEDSFRAVSKGDDYQALIQIAIAQAEAGFPSRAADTAAASCVAAETKVSIQHGVLLAHDLFIAASTLAYGGLEEASAECLANVERHIVGLAKDDQVGPLASLGANYAEVGNVEKANVYLRRAAMLASANSRYAVAAAQLRAGDKAGASFSISLMSGSLRAAALLLLVRAHLDEGNIGQAANTAARINARPEALSTLVHAFVLVAKAHAEDEDISAAEDVLTQATLSVSGSGHSRKSGETREEAEARAAVPVVAALVEIAQAQAELGLFSSVEATLAPAYARAKKIRRGRSELVVVLAKISSAEAKAANNEAARKNLARALSAEKRIGKDMVFGRSNALKEIAVAQAWLGDIDLAKATAADVGGAAYRIAQVQIAQGDFSGARTTANLIDGSQRWTLIYEIATAQLAEGDWVGADATASAIMDMSWRQLINGQIIAAATQAATSDDFDIERAIQAATQLGATNALASIAVIQAQRGDIGEAIDTASLIRGATPQVLDLIDTAVVETHLSKGNALEAVQTAEQISDAGIRVVVLYRVVGALSGVQPQTPLLQALVNSGLAVLR